MDLKPTGIHLQQPVVYKHNFCAYGESKVVCGRWLLVTLHHRKCLCKSFVPPKQLQKDGEMFPGCPGLAVQPDISLPEVSRDDHIPLCAIHTWHRRCSGCASRVTFRTRVPPIWVPLGAGVCHWVTIAAPVCPPGTARPAP